MPCNDGSPHHLRCEAFSKFVQLSMQRGQGIPAVRMMCPMFSQSLKAVSGKCRIRLSRDC
eukprot:UN2315